MLKRKDKMVKEQGNHVAKLQEQVKTLAREKGELTSDLAEYEQANEVGILSFLIHFV